MATATITIGGRELLLELQTARLAARVRDFMVRTGLGKHEMARVCALHYPTLHHLIGASRRHVSAAAAQRIEDFMANYVPEVTTIERGPRGNALIETPATRRAAMPEHFVATKTATTVSRALDMCARRRINGAIFGAPGCGKSDALRAWSSQTKHRHAIVFCRPYTPWTRLLQAIGRTLELPAARSGDLDEAIHRHLALQPTLLIVDEADMLNVRTLDWLRTIWDESDHQSSFVLLAKPAFYERLKVAHVRSRHQDLGQVWSRLAFRKMVGGITREEMDAYLAERGFAAALGAGAGDALYEACAGSFRDLYMLLEILQQILDDHSGKLKGKITVDAVDLASETRFGADMLRRRR